MSDCDHQKDKLVFRIASNGCRMFFRQCIECGRFTTSAISHNSLSQQQKDLADPVDDYLHTEWCRRKALEKKICNTFVSIKVNGFEKEGYVSYYDFLQLNKILENIEVKNDRSIEF